MLQSAKSEEYDMCVKYSHSFFDNKSTTMHILCMLVRCYAENAGERWILFKWVFLHKSVLYLDMIKRCLETENRTTVPRILKKIRYITFDKLDNSLVETV
jgi:hypothetical protein